MTASSRPLLTLTEFLTWENEQSERHEFHCGEVFAMVGGRRSHGRVVVNLLSAFHLQIKGSKCQVFGKSMKVEVEVDTVFYPDVFVTCDQADLATDMLFRAPTLVIEGKRPATPP